jgi:hypothetical protein
MKKILAVLILLSAASCIKLKPKDMNLNPARDLTGIWKGSNNQYTESEGGSGTPVCFYITATMQLELIQHGDSVTGSISGWVTSYVHGEGYCPFSPVDMNSSISGTISGTRLSLRDDCSYIGDRKGPTKYEFVFTTDNMEGTATEVATAFSCRTGITNKTNAIKLYRQK